MTKDVFPRDGSGYLEWLKTVAKKGEENMVILKWTQEFVDELINETTELEKILEDEIEAKKLHKGTVEAKNTALDASQKKMRPVIGLVQLNEDVTDELRGKMGINIHDKIPSHEVPYRISELKVLGQDNKINKIDWNKNGNKSGTQYILEVKYALDGDYQIVDTVTATKYDHKNQVPGKPAWYRITPRRGKLYGEPSEDVGVYT